MRGQANKLASFPLEHYTAAPDDEILVGFQNWQLTVGDVRAAYAQQDEVIKLRRQLCAVSVSVTGRADSEEAEIMACLDVLTEYFTDSECAKAAAIRAGTTSSKGERDA